MSWKMPKEMRVEFSKFVQESYRGSEEPPEYYVSMDAKDLEEWIEGWFEKLVSKEVEEIIHANKLV